MTPSSSKRWSLHRSQGGSDSGPSGGGAPSAPNKGAWAAVGRAVPNVAGATYQVLTTRLVPGTQGEITLWAPLIAWSVDALFLIRRVESIVVTMWFDRPIGDRLLHGHIDVPPPGSQRRRYFVCPGPDHAAGTQAPTARSEALLAGGRPGRLRMPGVSQTRVSARTLLPGPRAAGGPGHPAVVSALPLPAPDKGPGRGSPRVRNGMVHSLSAREAPRRTLRRPGQ
jgi:hypothetical protein